MDKNDQWNTATVIWVDCRTDETNMLMARIGFRQYNEHGDKEDSMGKYSGFSEALDEYIGIHTCRLQKPYSQTTLKDLSGNSVAMDPDVVLHMQQTSTTSEVNQWEKMES